MKKDTIQSLLAKRQAGTLTEAEMEELNRLTHRDEVMAEADRRAGGIIRSHRAGLVAFAAVVVVTAGVLFLQPRQEAPLVAERQPMAVQQPEVQPEAVVEREAVAEPVQMAAVKPVRRKAHASAPAKDDEPVVMCNSQCDADSVISDIWKFLSA